MILKLIVYLLAGMGAGIGTGLAGLSAAAVISPMLITFLHFDPYQAVGIALASDVLASAVSAYTYKKHGNLDVRHGIIMLSLSLHLPCSEVTLHPCFPAPPWATFLYS